VPVFHKHSVSPRPDHNMSLADAFAAALAKKKKTTLATGGHDFPRPGHGPDQLVEADVYHPMHSAGTTT
jgi:hypothetical protein